MNEITVLIISGPVGVGKTSVGEEVSEVLDNRGVPHTFIDFDQLRYTYPVIPEDPWSNDLGFQNLAAIWPNCVARGARNLVVATVVEEAVFVRQMEATIPNSVVRVAQLNASPQTLIKRVEKREVGSGLDWHKARSLELREILLGADVPCDFRIDTDEGSLVDIATKMVDLLDWRLASS